MEAVEAMDMEASKDSVDTDIRDVCWRQNERGIENKKGINGRMNRRAAAHYSLFILFVCLYVVFEWVRLSRVFRPFLYPLWSITDVW